MRIFLSAVAIFSAIAAPAAAITVKSDETFGKSQSAFEKNISNLNLNIVQQINIPTTINQAFAIGILSRDVVAYAQTSVVSVNNTNSVFMDFNKIPGSSEPLDLQFVDGLLAALGVPSFGVSPTSWFPASPQGGAGSPWDKETIAPVPLPAALPLFTAAFGWLGLIGRRRQRELRRRLDSAALPLRFSDGLTRLEA